MRIGDIELIPLSDGIAKLPQQFYIGLDFATHPELLAEDGRVHIPIGCYLLRTDETTVLLDAGMGPRSLSWGEGGHLPAELAKHGVSPADIDIVVASHLHTDHVGWLAVDGVPFFPNATVRYGHADWDEFVTNVEPEDHTRHVMEALADADRLQPIEGDMVSLAPGLTARATPGHTLGHYCLVVSSREERAFLLGDAVECPLQLEEPDFYAMSDVDPKLAARTRDLLWRELEGTDALVGAAHFQGLEFGRVLRGTGTRYRFLGS